MSQVDCSVITLAHNGADFTSHCLESLLTAEDHPRELFIVDNGSTDRTADVIADFRDRFVNAGIDFITWRNSENKGCSRARNEAWEKATATYTVLLDNDAAVCTTNWLTRLSETMEREEKLAILGPKMIYPYLPHPIQCAGVSINKLGRIAFRGRGKPRRAAGFCEFRDVPALISACWMMKTDLRDTIGALDELFHPVQYEDLDLCLRAMQAGLRVAYTPEVEMYHFEGITTASFGQKEYRKNIARNSLKFRERWHSMFPTFADDLAPEEYRWLQREELGLQPKVDLQLCD